MWEIPAFDDTRADDPGGGFLNATNNFPSPSKPQDDRRRADRITNIVPCTIAQVLQVPESEEHLKIGHLPAHIITVVGIVRGVDRQSARFIFLIDDLSGKPIEAQFWIADDASNPAENIAIHSYVRVTGALRAMRGKRHIIIFKIRPITDLNELTMHLLEVIQTSMAVVIMNRTSESDSVAQADSVPFKAAGTLSSFASYPADNTCFGAVNTLQGLNKPQQMVLQAIIACKDPQGAHISNIVNQSKSLGRKVIMDALEFLSNEGHIYSTIDDDHFKTTDSG